MRGIKIASKRAKLNNALFFILTQKFLALYRLWYTYECHTDTTKGLCVRVRVCVWCGVSMYGETFHCLHHKYGSKANQA